MCGNPGVFAIVTGSAAVICGLLLAAYSAYYARRDRNAFWWLSAAGSFVFVVGIIGQRAYYLADAQANSGCTKSVSRTPGIWDASITLPIFSVDFVSLVGILAVIAAGCLALFFEPSEDAKGPQLVDDTEALEAGDAV